MDAISRAGNDVAAATTTTTTTTPAAVIEGSLVSSI